MRVVSPTTVCVARGSLTSDTTESAAGGTSGSRDCPRDLPGFEGRLGTARSISKIMGAKGRFGVSQSLFCKQNIQQLHLGLSYTSNPRSLAISLHPAHRMGHGTLGSQPGPKRAANLHWSSGSRGGVHRSGWDLGVGARPGFGVERLHEMRDGGILPVPAVGCLLACIFVTTKSSKRSWKIEIFS